MSARPLQDRAQEAGALPVTLADIRAAADTIAGAVERTPWGLSGTSSGICG